MDNTKTETRVQTVCLLILTAIMGAFCLHWLQSVAVPLVLAAFLATILTPLIDVQARYLRLPRLVAITVTLIVVLVVMALTVGAVADSLGNLASEAKTYEAHLAEILRRPEAGRLLHVFGIDLGADMDIGSIIPPGLVNKTLLGLIKAMSSFLSNTFLIFLFVIFLLAGKSVTAEPKDGTYSEIETGIKNYVGTKILLSALTGFLVFVILRLFGVPYALSFGAIAFVLNFIPNLGSIIATLVPLPVMLFLPDLTMTGVLATLLLMAAVQMIIGNVVEPKMLGKSLDLHPVTVLAALVLWGAIWGFPGMILAVPLTSVVKVVLENVEITSPVANLLSGTRTGLGSEA
jgi:AI-2 transport protein TqsA